MSAFNALYNLGLSGERAYAVGVVGNDENGRKALGYLAAGNVDVRDVEVRNRTTNVTHILVHSGEGDDRSLVTSVSPLTNKRSGALCVDMPTSLPERFHDKDLILVVSNVNPDTKLFIEDARAKAGSIVVALDLNRLGMFANRTPEYVDSFLREVDLLQLNQSNFAHLCEKVGCPSWEDFFRRYSPELLTVTQGAKGAVFLYRDEKGVRTLEKGTVVVSEILDPTGAGDAFHSMMLKAYHGHVCKGLPITEDYLHKAFRTANKLAARVVTVVGSRGPASIMEGLFEEEL